MTLAEATLFLGVLGVSVAAGFAALGLLRRRVIDQPNPRSSHTTPIPRGGGVGFMVVIVAVLFALWAVDRSSVTLAVILGTVAVAGVSFVDDLRGLSARVRLGVQVLAVAAAVATLPADGPILAAILPVWLDRILIGLAWLWFLNLFNFMDGIDGIAAGEAGIVATGIVVVGLVRADFGIAIPEGLVIAAAAFGFLAVNWHPARLFMGDVGSIGLGYILGWLLIDSAASGALAAALILPAFFVLDATSTLIARALRRQPLTTPHRLHAYQAAVDRGMPQPLVSGIVIWLGIALVGPALASVTLPLVGSLVGVALTVGVLVWLRWGRVPQPRPPSESSAS